MKNKISLEFLILKNWKELHEKLHWGMYKLGSEVNNENTSLWKQLRKEK